MNPIKKLIEHAEEKHPHFEDTRGLDDIEEAKAFMASLEVFLDSVIKSEKTSASWHENAIKDLKLFMKNNGFTGWWLEE